MLQSKSLHLNKVSYRNGYIGTQLSRPCIAGGNVEVVQVIAFTYFPRHGVFTTSGAKKKNIHNLSESFMKLITTALAAIIGQQRTKLLKNFKNASSSFEKRTIIHPETVIFAFQK